MATWRWRTAPDGRVEVDKGSGFETPVLLDHPNVRKTLDRTMQWWALAEKYGTQYGVPVSWLLGDVYAESGGNAAAQNYCCYGLMAIFAKVHGKTPQQMLDPSLNLEYGTSLFAASRKKGLDLPATASVHVAGGGTSGLPHPSTTNPWGMREHSWVGKPDADGSVGYIDRVVRANNTFVKLLGGRMLAGAMPSGGFEWLIAAVAGVAGYKAADALLR